MIKKTRYQTLLKRLSAGVTALAILGIIVVLINISNATLVCDDVYAVQALPSIMEKQGFFHTLQTLFFNSDVRSEYRLFGLSRVFHFLLSLLFGAHAWPYAAVIAVSQTATALGIYWLLRRLDVDHFQSGALAVVWLLSPFSSTSAFWHYSYFILPYQLTVACALVLQRLHDRETHLFSSWHGAVVVLCLAIAWTGETHLIASVVFLGLVIIATPSTRLVRQRFLDLAVVVLTIFAAIAFHRWGWSVLSGGFDGRKLRYVFAIPTLEEVRLRTAGFIQSLVNGAETQIVPIVAFAKGWALATALASGLVVGLMWWCWWRDEAGNTASIQRRNWFDFRISVALLVILLASLAILWQLFVLSGWGIGAIFRRYGYIPYTIGAMTVVALLTAPPVRRRLRSFPGVIACGIIVWLWLTLNFACLPVVRAQDKRMWSEVAACLAQKRDPSILFVSNWNRPEMPGYELEGGTPGLRGQSFPEIFESPLPAYWWESEYATAVVGAHYTGYQALPEADGRIRLFGTGSLRKSPVIIPSESLIVVVNPSLTPPLWNSDLSHIKVFTTWDAFQTSMKRDLLGSWQTPNGTVNIVTNDDSIFFLIDRQSNKLAVTIQPSRLHIPSQNNEGQVNTERTRIDWSDGSAWTRSSPAFEHNPKYQAVAKLLGQWYIAEERCTIEFTDLDNRELSLVNEHRARAPATLRGRTINAVDSKIQGELSPDGRIISWSNGTVWHR